MKVPKIPKGGLPLDTGTGENVPEHTWLSVMEPNIRKFEVASFTNGQAVWNAKGSKAMATLLRKMCSIIDDEINRRREHGQREHPPRQAGEGE